MIEKEIILATLEDYAKAYCAKDIDRLMAVFDEGEDISLIGTGPLQVPVRWTVALVKREGGWKWLHRHASPAAGSQRDGTAYPEGSSD